MNEIKVLILCNNPIAVPCIREFLFFGKVAAIAIPKRNKEMQFILEQLLANTGVPLLLITKKEFKEQLPDAIHQYKPTVGLIMTFPFIIPSTVLIIPPKGFINFHFGILPQCRGPQPILWHLLNNDKEAGVTIHQVDEGIDTGPVVMQERIPILESDTYGMLQSKLAFLAAKLGANLLRILSYGTFTPSSPQDESKAVYYEMPSAQQLTIDWVKMTADNIVRLTNACNPWNKGAGTKINEWIIGITEAIICGECDEIEKATGTILVCNCADGLVVKTADHKKLRINIVFTNEGFFSGYRLSSFGINAGMKLG